MNKLNLPCKNDHDILLNGKEKATRKLLFKEGQHKCLNTKQLKICTAKDIIKKKNKSPANKIGRGPAWWQQRMGSL